MTADNNLPPPGDDAAANEPGPGRVRWLDLRFNGMLLCRVNAADPTHIQIKAAGHGHGQVVEASTKTLGVTGGKAV